MSADNPTVSSTSEGFEDNFVVQGAGEFEKLADSQEYLSKLEGKLKRLQNKSTVLEQLRSRREHLIENLLATSDPLEQRISNLDLDQPVGLGSGQQTLRAFLNPEQPLTVGEILNLVKHDELATESGEEETEEQPQSSNIIDPSKGSAESPPSR